MTLTTTETTRTARAPRARRKEMVDHQLRRRGIRDERVLDAMARVPREHFVPQRLRDQAYVDGPLPLGCGATISQPYVVAVMLQALALKGHERVLDVGAGSGYQTALLCELADEVVGIEHIPGLAKAARTRLREFDYDNGTIVVGDGRRGHADRAPYDGIIIGAAASDPPPALIDQLSDDGRLVMPVGNLPRQLLHCVSFINGEPAVNIGLGPCKFVPLVEYADDQPLPG